MNNLNEYDLPRVGRPLPPGWQSMDLNDILTPEQRQHYERLKKENPDPEKLLKAMKQYFNIIGPDLEAKGVLPDFLAYILYAKQLNVI